MAVKPGRTPPPNRRAAPEAIAKRRAGRAFNDLFEAPLGGRLDGRTEKRRQRLLDELEHGRRRGSKRELKPLEVLAHVDELLALGEAIQTIKKVVKPHSGPRSADDSALQTLRDMHEAYGFRAEAYRFVGVSEDLLREAGILDDGSGGRRSPSIRPLRRDRPSER